MKLAIRVFYRIELLPVVCSFVSTTAQAFGASDKEQTQLCLAAEEATMHILESFPPDDAEDVFEITCTVRENGLEYEFKNLGLPLNVEAMPAYDAAAPAETEDGLRLYLMRQMVDRLDFINRGHEGWRTRLFKTIASVRPLAPLKETDAAPGERERISASVAAVSDVHDIVRLAYLTYRYSYAKESFYYAEKLKVELEQGRIASFIARTSSGLIVGHIARMLDAHCPVVAEIGAVMVRPEYRHSSGLLTLLKTTVRYRDDLRERIQLYTSNLVTAHVLSQKLASLMAFKPLALQLSTHARAQFQAIQAESGRESNLYAVRVQQAPADFAVYVPDDHAGMARRLFENAALPAAVRTDRAPAAAARTDWRMSHDTQTHYATLRTREIGEDFAESLRSATYELSTERIETIALHLPAWRPLPAETEQALLLHSYFFCGFVHATPEKWYLLYTRLSNQRFQFDTVRIHDPVADELKNYIRQHYEKLIG